MNNELGEVSRDGARVRLRYRRRLDRPPGDVWTALTESDRLRHWLPCDVVGERRTGAPISLPFWDAQLQAYDIPADQSALSGEIRVWDPPHVFEWTWDVDLLRWELAADGDGTLLTFTTWLGESENQEYPVAQVAAGWHICLDELIELVETGTVVVQLVDVATAEWEARYGELVKS